MVMFLLLSDLLQFLNLPKLVASKMVGITLLLLLVLSLSYSTTDALVCRAGFSAAGALGSDGEAYEVECAGPNFEDHCYVMYTDNFIPQFENPWTFGCLKKGDLDKCDRRLHEHGVDNYYCCCKDANCNDKRFAAKCRSVENLENMKTPKSIITPKYMKPTHYEL